MSNSDGQKRGRTVEFPRGLYTLIKREAKKRRMLIRDFVINTMEKELRGKSVELPRGLYDEIALLEGKSLQHIERYLVKAARYCVESKIAFEK